MAFTGMVTTFRTLGAAGALAPPQCLFTLENLAGSSVTVIVRRLVLQLDCTAAYVNIMPQLKLSRFATPSSPVGTTLAKGTAISSQASSTLVQARGATASDGGAAVTLLSPHGFYLWQQYATRQHTIIAQIQSIDSDMLPVLCADIDYEFRLYAGEGIAVHIVTPTTVANPATNHYFVNCVWEEKP
jgi:hypothetical protein